VKKQGHLAAWRELSLEKKMQSHRHTSQEETTQHITSNVICGIVSRDRPSGRAKTLNRFQPTARIPMLMADIATAMSEPDGSPAPVAALRIICAFAIVASGLDSGPTSA
jgi:hypothetical protein